MIDPLTAWNSSMLNAMQFFPSWTSYMDEPTGETLGRLSAMYSIGSIASLPVVPYMSDHFGRRMPIIIGCSIMVAAASIQTAAVNLPMFEGARFFMGFGNSLAQLSAPLLLTEICHPQHRARITAVYNCLWNVGALICSWISFGTQYMDNDWSWRIPTLIQAFPSVIQLMFIFWIPESPRWLLSKERTEEALQMLGKYHADGNVDDPLVQFEYEEIKETIRLEFLAKKTSSFSDFIKTKGNRYRLMLIISLGLFSQWSGNALFSYYANKVYAAAGVDDPQSGLGLDGGNKVLSLIVSISCALLCDRVGRRPLFLAATGGMLLCLMAATIAGSQYSKTGDTGTGIAVIVFFWFHGVCYAFAWSGLLIAYTVEILPFKLRAKGMMIMNIAVNVALVINNQVNPIPMDGAWKGSEWKLYFFYVETKYAPTFFFPHSPATFTNILSLTGVPLSKKSPASSTATTPRSASRTSKTTRSFLTSAATMMRSALILWSSARRFRTKCKKARRLIDCSRCLSAYCSLCLCFAL
jgi:sugar porter (SP) family MFS transporter